MTQEFTATRTMLANAMATAGAELLQYMKTAGALAAIPDTDPQQYVVAGTLGDIVKLLPAVAPAVQAQAELTDERIAEIYRSEFNGAPNAAREAPRNVPPLVIEFAHAIEREVRSAAGSASPAAAPPAAYLIRDKREQARFLKGASDWTPCSIEDYELRKAHADIFEFQPLHLATPSSEDDRSAAREQARNEAQWISVDERLPDDDCRVLAATWFTMTHDQHMDIVSFRRGSGQFSHSDVTHWMPLPRPPKEAP